MAGTPQKMLEHLLETRLDGRNSSLSDSSVVHDPFLDDFLLTHLVFMSTQQLIQELTRQYPFYTFIYTHNVFFSLTFSTYRIDSPNQDREFLLACKRRVVHFVYRWATSIRYPVFEDNNALEFIEVRESLTRLFLFNGSLFQDLATEVEADCIQWNAMQEEATLMHHVMQLLKHYQEDKNQNAGQKWKLPPCGQPISLFSASCSESRTIIRPSDDSKLIIIPKSCHLKMRTK